MSINSKKSRLDDFFEQATEDSSTYLSKVIDLHDPSGQEDESYLILSMIACRNRSQRAFRCLGSEEIPSSYQKPLRQLKQLFREGEACLSKVISERGTAFFEDIAHATGMSIAGTGNLLERVYRIAQDGDLIEDQDWIKDDLQAFSQDFLIEFMDLSLIISELDEKPFSGNLSIESLQNEYRSLEKRFRKNYGYFSSSETFLKSMKEREYDIDFWWLNTSPESDFIEDVSSAKNILEEAVRLYDGKKADRIESCEFQDQTIAFALNDVPSESRDKIQEHIQSCDYCLELFLDTRIADDASFEEAVDMDFSALPEAEKKKSFDFSTNLGRIFQKCRDFFTLPRLIPAVTIACLLIVAVNIQQNTSLQPSTDFGFTIIARTNSDVVTRGETPVGKEIILKENDVLKSGDYFQIKLKAESDIYLYLLLLDSSGVLNGFEHGYVAAGTSLGIPGTEQWYQLDDSVGRETIYIVSSGDKIADFEDRLLKIKSLGVDKIQTIFPEETIKSFSFMHN